jgi:hypothetical protein
MKKLYLFHFLLIFFLAGDLSFSQSSFEWRKTYGGSGNEYYPLVLRTADHGFLIAGSSVSNDMDVSGNHGNYDIWVVRTDSSGNISWKKCFGGTQEEFLNAAIRSSDGNYLLLGYSRSADGDLTNNKGKEDLWIFKIDDTGTLQWQKAYGGSENDEGTALFEDAEGNILVAGNTESANGDVTSNHGSSDIWMLKLNPSGGMLWQKTVGGSMNDLASTILSNGEDGYMISGSSNSGNGDITGHYGLTDKSDYIAFETDTAGNIGWMKNYGGNEDDRNNGMIRTNDGGYLLYGISDSDNGDITGNHGYFDGWLIKLSSAGSVQWQKSIGGSQDDAVDKIIQRSDDCLIACGNTYSNDIEVSGNHGMSDCWMLKLDPSGPIIWQKTFGGSDIDYLSDIILINDESCVASACTQSDDGDVPINHGALDYWIFKLSSLSSLEDHSFTEETFFTLYPNPVTDGNIKIELNRKSGGTVNAELLDLSGRKIMTTEFNGNSSGYMDISALSKGVYFIRLQGETLISIKKLIIQ